MKRLDHGPATLAALVLACSGLAGAEVLGAVEHRESESREWTLAKTDGRRLVVVDNIEGSVVVTAGAGDRVAIEVTKTYVARSASELEAARREYVLDVVERPGVLELVQETPHCRRRAGERWRDCDDRRGRRGTAVRFDWKITVPKEVDLDLRNVNDGAVEVTGVAGEIDAANVNGAIALKEIAGRVRAQSVNDDVTATFRELPKGDLEFATVNGEIDLAFPRGFGAELDAETMNGEVRTDFDFALAKLPPTASRGRREDGQFRAERGRVRIGAGGVTVECKTINGDIWIRERS